MRLSLLSVLKISIKHYTLYNNYYYYYYWWYVRPDLLLSLSNGSLYVVELTVGYETNLENNVKRKKAKYRELVRQLDKNFNKGVNFVNLSMSSLGIFAQECSTFLEMLGNVGLDKNYQTYCVRKMMTIAIRSTCYTFSAVEIRNGKVRTC